MSELRSSTRRQRRRSPWPRRLVIALVVLAVFVLGIAVGQALNDGPPPPATETYIRTLTTPGGSTTTTTAGP